MSGAQAGVLRLALVPEQVPQGACGGLPTWTHPTPGATGRPQGPQPAATAVPGLELRLALPHPQR